MSWDIAYWILVLLVLTNGISFIWGKHFGRKESQRESEQTNPV